MRNRKIIVGSIILIVTMIFTTAYIILRSKVTMTESIQKDPEPSMSPPPSLLPLSTAVQEKGALRWPMPTFKPVMESFAGSKGPSYIKNNSPKRYLNKNPITVNQCKVSENNKGYKIELNYPQIDGLLDLSVQDKINSELKSYSESIQRKADTYNKDLKEIRMNYDVTANYNNILCIKINQFESLKDASYMEENTLLYELVSGRRLELGDIFTSETEFPSILNRAIGAYILKNNLEEQLLEAPFKGIRVDQNYELTEDTLKIDYRSINEINTSTLVYGPDGFIFKLTDFKGAVDIYDKYSNPGKEIYKNPSHKKKMIANSFKADYVQYNYHRENYNAFVGGRMFSGMSNSQLEKRLNELCSYTGENEFKKLIPDKGEKPDPKNLPNINRDYGITANYCDVLCLSCSEHYSIPVEKVDKSREWHITYNVISGNKLELKNLFKKDYDWQDKIIAKMKEISAERGASQEQYSKLDFNKADFWFDEDNLWLNIKPEEFVDDPDKNKNIFKIPFEYFGEDNLAVRE